MPFQAVPDGYPKTLKNLKSLEDTPEFILYPGYIISDAFWTTEENNKGNGKSIIRLWKDIAPYQYTTPKEIRCEFQLGIRWKKNHFQASLWHWNNLECLHYIIASNTVTSILSYSTISNQEVGQVSKFIWTTHNLIGLKKTSKQPIPLLRF